MKKRILTMHFSNKSDPDLPASFSFRPTRLALFSLLAAKKLRANSIGTFNPAAKFRASTNS
jgi:hypothetical protein